VQKKEKKKKGGGKKMKKERNYGETKIKSEMEEMRISIRDSKCGGWPWRTFSDTSPFRTAVRNFGDYDVHYFAVISKEKSHTDHGSRKKLSATAKENAVRKVRSDR